MKAKRYYIEAKFKRHREADIWIVVGKTIKITNDKWLKKLLEGMLVDSRLFEILDLPETAQVDTFRIIERSK